MRTCRTAPPTGARSTGSPGPGRRGPHRPPDGRLRVDVRAPVELDLGSAPALVERVLALASAGADVSLDAGGTAFVDCCGLAALERCLVLGGPHVRLGRRSAALEQLVALVAGPASPLRPGCDDRTAASA